MRWGTNENCISRITLGTNEMGDQWELYNQGYIGGPMRWGANENGAIEFKQCGRDL